MRLDYFKDEIKFYVGSSDGTTFSWKDKNAPFKTYFKQYCIAVSLMVCGGIEYAIKMRLATLDSNMKGCCYIEVLGNYILLDAYTHLGVYFIAPKYMFTK